MIEFSCVFVTICEATVVRLHPGHDEHVEETDGDGDQHADDGVQVQHLPLLQTDARHHPAYPCETRAKTRDSGVPGLNILCSEIIK